MTRLTKIDTEHLPYVQEFASDPAIGATSNMPHPYPEDGAWLWYALVLKRMEEGVSQVFAILDEGFAGVVAINAISRESRTCEVDYWVAKHKWSKGVCTAAVGQGLLYCKHVLGIQAAFSASLVRNPGSRRVLEKNGFEDIGRFINQGQFANVHLEPMIRYRKTLTEGGIGTPDPKGVGLERAAFGGQS